MPLDFLFLESDSDETDGNGRDREIDEKTQRQLVCSTMRPPASSRESMRFPKYC